MSSGQEIASWVCLVLFPLLALGCYFIMHWHRKQLFFLKRDESAIIVASFAGWLAYFALVVSMFGGIPCGILYVASSLVMPLSVGPQLIRALLLHGRFEAAEYLVEEEISARERRKTRTKGDLSTIPSGSEYKSSDGEQKANPNDLVAASEFRNKADLAIGRTHRRIIITKSVLIIVPLVTIIIAWWMTSVEQGNLLLLKTFDECKEEPPYFQYADLSFSILGLVAAMIACYYIKDVEDELFLHREFTETAVIFALTDIVIIAVMIARRTELRWLLQTIQQMVLLCSMVIIPCCPECKAATKVRSWFRKKINPASKSSVPAYAQPLPQFHRASTRAASRNSILGQKLDDRTNREANISWDAGLCILLSSEEGIKAFTRHCAREFSCENIRFWCAVKDFKTKYDETTSTTTALSDDLEHDNARDICVSDHTTSNITDDANVIYKKFIDHNHSNDQVNLSSKQRHDIKALIESGDINVNIFDSAQKEIFSVMSRDSYPRFLASKKNRTPI